jgi:hypothetical protein
MTEFLIHLMKICLAKPQAVERQHQLGHMRLALGVLLVLLQTTTKVSPAFDAMNLTASWTRLGNICLSFNVLKIRYCRPKGNRADKSDIHSLKSDFASRKDAKAAKESLSHSRAIRGWSDERAECE